MVTFCIAYKNEHTIEWAERTGNMAGGWIRISAFLDFTEAKRLLEIRAPEMSNSAVAMFANHQNDPVAWYERRPRYISNSHILTAGAPISADLAGLINARESDWF